MARLMAAAAAGAIGLSAAAGCGKPVLRVADPSLGDYYTEEEFKKLRQDQRDEYCNELALQDSSYREEIREGREALEALRVRREPMRREIDSLAAEAGRLERRLAESRAARPADAATGAGAPARWTVRPGESLWRIAARDDVYGDGRRWPRLYEANKDRIGSPDLIYPGQEITIPR